MTKWFNHWILSVNKYFGKIEHNNPDRHGLTFPSSVRWRMSFSQFWLQFRMRSTWFFLFFRAWWRNMEGHIRTPFSIEANQLLQCCRVDYIKTSLTPKCTGLPVLWWTYGISQKAFQRKRCTHLHHALSKYGTRPCFLQQQSWIELQSVNISIEILQLACNFCLTWKIM